MIIKIANRASQARKIRKAASGSSAMKVDPHVAELVENAKAAQSGTSKAKEKASELFHSAKNKVVDLAQNKKVAIPVAAAALLATGGGAYLHHKNKKAS